MVVTTIALNRTTWGRHLFATGGSVDAARRAGMDVIHIRVTAFTICSAAALPPSYQNIITGAVLLIAAGIDALSRRRSATRRS
jgi:D-xylose transport system permease protein